MRRGCPAKPRPSSQRASQVLEGACERFEDGGAGVWVRRPSAATGRPVSCGAEATLMPMPIAAARPVPFGPRDALDQDASDLGAAEQNVVRPFKAQAAELFRGQMAGYGIEGGERGDERELGGSAGAYAEAQPEGRVEIALRRVPAPAAAAAPFALLIRDDPERASAPEPSCRSASAFVEVEAFEVQD